jgi:hypothetical protein
VASRRALDTAVEIMVDGAPLVTNLSDHFGALVTVTPR